MLMHPQPYGTFALPEVSGRAVVTKLAILGPGQEFWNDGRSALFGLPESSLGVVVTPEMALLKVERQNAYARLHRVTRDRDGRPLAESAMVTRRADFNVYTVFFIAFRDSDIYDESTVGFD